MGLAFRSVLWGVRLSPWEQVSQFGVMAGVWLGHLSVNSALNSALFPFGLMSPCLSNGGWPWITSL